MDLVNTAAKIAAIAHRNQLRKQGDIPYIMHPTGVALKVAKYGFSDEAIAAALVHDVLEDTDFPEDELREKMGPKVMTIVDSVTNDDSLSWIDKKKKYIETVRAGSDEAKAVATADKIHNAEDLLLSYETQGKEIWKNFNRNREKKIWFEEAMLKMLKEEWSHPIIKEYEVLVDKMKAMDS